MIDLKELGMLIKIWRVKNNMTQEQLAKLLGVSRITVGCWESGEKEPMASSFVKIVELLGISWEEVVTSLRLEKKTTMTLHERVQRLEYALQNQGISI